MTAEAVTTAQGAGDEPWLSLVLFNFRFDDLVSIDLDDAPSIDPLPVDAHPRSVRGNNYFKEGEVHAVWDASYDIHGTQPLTLFGIVPVVIEQEKRGDEGERDRAAACVRDEVFERLRRLNDFQPDYTDQSASNARNVARILVDRMQRLRDGLSTIRDRCEEHLSRDHLFRPDLVFWIHAPELDPATLTEWINDGYGGGLQPLLLDDFGTFQMSVTLPRSGIPGTVGPPPAQYHLLGSLRLMGGG